MTQAVGSTALSVSSKMILSWVVQTEGKDAIQRDLAQA